MHTATTAAVAALMSLADANAAPAAPSTEQIKDQCDAIHGGPDGVRRADRTGVTVQQAFGNA